MILAIDPGLKTLAWALGDAGRLVACGLSRTKETTVEAQARAHRQNVMTAIAGGPARLRIVCERMVHRGAHAKTRNAQALIDINLIAGYLANEWLAPSEWKGMVPKDIHQPRIRACLTAKERALIDSVKPASLVHNVVDAAGILAYVQGRLEIGSWSSARNSVTSLLPASMSGTGKTTAAPTRRGRRRSSSSSRTTRKSTSGRWSMPKSRAA